jgi:hypothetical protein
MNDSISDGFPSAQAFAGQLIRQLYADLDQLLFDDDRPAAHAFALIEDAARSGSPRGASLQLLVGAALAAHRSLLEQNDEASGPAAPAGDGVFLHLVPRAAAQLPALRSHAERVTRYLGMAEARGEPLQAALSRAIFRLYDGLRSGDEARSGAGLTELRAMLVHIDAVACTIDTPEAAAPARVIRPDRFHDWFLRYTATAQQPQAPEPRAIATLTREGRIAAVITEDRHPLEAADRSVREAVGQDHGLQTAALARIHALIGLIDQQRRADGRFLGEALDDPAVHISLVTAAATAPLRLGGRFAFGAFAQIARYNRRLLSAAARTAHVSGR